MIIFLLNRFIFLRAESKFIGLSFRAGQRKKAASWNASISERIAFLLAVLASNMCPLRAAQFDVASFMKADSRIRL